MLTPALYRTLTGLASPALPLLLERRARRGKEDRERLGERLGRAALSRPEGPLLWVHAVSVGEAVSALPLIDRLIEERRLEVLLTTGTTSSARLVAPRLPARCRHQYVPVDLPRAVARFLDHWRPDAGLFVEAELWPNLVLAAQARGIPLALVNARMTPPTLRRWQRHPRLIAPVLGAFDPVLARGSEDAARFAALGARPAVPGDLKYAAPPLDCDDAALDALRRAVGGRPRWLAASTHPGEDEMVTEAHRRLAARRPDLLTVIAPRHPERGPDIADLARRGGLAVARRAAGERPDSATAIYVADTMGELGLLFRLAGTVFMGGSLVAVGGHNLLEPARLGAALVHGPHMDNFRELATDFARHGAAVEVADGDALAEAIGLLLDDEDARRRLARAAARCAAEKAGILDVVVAALAPVLDRMDGSGGGRARA